MKKSEYGKLNLKDLLRGALLAALMTVVSALITALEHESILVLLEFAKIKIILISGLSAGSLYMLKNLVTNSKDEALKNE